MGFMINKNTYEVQTAPSERVMVENGWSTEEWVFVEELKDFESYNGYLKNIALKQQIYLIEHNYELKAKIAYTGIFWDYSDNNISKEVLFQTNANSMSMISSTYISFTKEDSSKDSINWKFWTVGEPLNYPLFIPLTKENFLKFHYFAETMIDSAVNIESEYNSKILLLTLEELTDSVKVNKLLEDMEDSYKSINTKIMID